MMQAMYDCNSTLREQAQRTPRYQPEDRSVVQRLIARLRGL